MAFLKFRGNTTSPTKPSSTTAANAPLSNLDIDGNFASLNDSKLELTGHTVGDIFYANSGGAIIRLARGADGQVLKLAAGIPAWGTDNDTIYTLPVATSTVFGGIELGSDTVQTVSANAVSATASRTYALQVNSLGQAVVNVPWVDTDTDTNTTYSAGTGLTLTGTSFSVNYGNTATTACIGNDSRLSDARTPTAHTHAASDITSGTIATARLASGTANSATFLRGDQTWATITSGASLLNDTTTVSDAFYPTMAFNATTGSPSTLFVSSTQFYFNPSTGTINSTSFNSLSDIRYKNQLEKISSALNKVKTLSGYTFNLIESNTKSAGLVAQEVQNVLPEAIGGNEEKLTVSYGAVMGLIVEAIKELDSKLEDIRNTILNK